MNAEDKNTMIGCGLFVVIGAALVYGFVAFFHLDAAPESESEAEKEETSKRVALSKVEPARRKTVVKKAAKIEKLAKHIPIEDSKVVPVRPKGVAAAVENLGAVAEDAPPPPEAELAQAVLDATPLCWRGRLARRVKSLYTRYGFAISYGSADYNGGDPLPRLEIFVNGQGAEAFASYLSMTHEKVKGFENKKEVAIPYSSDAINAVIARWIVAVADETCPDLAPKR